MEIAHQTGVVLCEQYEDKINGDMFSDFIEIHFQETLSWWTIPKEKRLLQDGYPVQNSKKSRQALDTVVAIKFSMPPSSPNFNPIGNILVMSKVNYVLRLSKKYKLWNIQTVFYKNQTHF